MAAFTEMLIPLEIHIIAVVLCVIFVLINIIGIKEVGIVQRFIVFGLLSILIFYIAKGFGSVNVDHFKPFAPKGIAPVFATAGFVFISFGGLLKVASVAEEVKN